MDFALLLAEGESTFNVTSVISDVMSIFSTASSTVMANPVCLLFIGFGLAGAGIKLFKKVVRFR